MDSFRGLGSTIVVTGNGSGVRYEETPGEKLGIGQRKEETPRQGARPWSAAEQLLGLSNVELGEIDPVVMNLVVARGIPSLANLDIGHYVRLADQWAAEIRGYLPEFEAAFCRNPRAWRNDLDLCRLVTIARFVGEALRIDYREDQKNLAGVWYTDPTDLFLNGVMDNRQGTCANMALLWVVLGRRLGWPVSLACVGPHKICRYDDGRKAFNIEATFVNGSDWCSPPDRHYVCEVENHISQRGSIAGLTSSANAARNARRLFRRSRRHLRDINRFADAEPDYLVARYLFPRIVICA